jgi:hypothetical protein
MSKESADVRESRNDSGKEREAKRAQLEIFEVMCKGGKQLGYLETNQMGDSSHG